MVENDNESAFDVPGFIALLRMPEHKSFQQFF